MRHGRCTTSRRPAPLTAPTHPGNGCKHLRLNVLTHRSSACLTDRGANRVAAVLVLAVLGACDGPTDGERTHGPRAKGRSDL